MIEEWKMHQHPLNAELLSQIIVFAMGNLPSRSYNAIRSKCGVDRIDGINIG